MKVERVQPPATIKVELDEATADLLCALLGGIKGGPLDDRSLFPLFSALDDALPHRTISFSDRFVSDANGFGISLRSTLR